MQLCVKLISPESTVSIFDVGGGLMQPLPFLKWEGKYDGAGAHDCLHGYRVRESREAGLHIESFIRRKSRYYIQYVLYGV